MICWYQPTETFYKKRLIHTCSDNPKQTSCGLDIDPRWILWDYEESSVTCKKCIKLLNKSEDL